jgi:hypothetical protein
VVPVPGVWVGDGSTFTAEATASGAALSWSYRTAEGEALTPAAIGTGTARLISRRGGFGSATIIAVPGQAMIYGIASDANVVTVTFEQTTFTVT